MGHTTLSNEKKQLAIGEKMFNQIDQKKTREKYDLSFLFSKKNY